MLRPGDASWLAARLPALLGDSAEEPVDTLLARALHDGCPHRPASLDRWSCPPLPGGLAEGWDCPGGWSCPALAVLEVLASEHVPPTAQVLALLAQADVRLLCAAALERLLRAQVRVEARLALARAETVLALAHAAAAPLIPPDEHNLEARLVEAGTVADPGVERVAVALRVSKPVAMGVVATARRLHGAELDARPDQLPASGRGVVDGFALLREDLAAGLTTAAHAAAVLYAARVLPEHAAHALLVHPRLRQALHASTAQHAGRVATELGPELMTPQELAAREDRAARRAEVRVSSDGHGSGRVDAVLPILDAEAHAAALEQAVRQARAAGDVRPVRAIEAEAFALYAWDALGVPRPELLPFSGQPWESDQAVPAARAASTPPAALLPPPAAPLPPPTAPSAGSGDGVTLGLTIDYATLIGLGEHPGRLDRLGVLSPELARVLALEARSVQLLIHDQHGQLLLAGRTHRFAPRLGRTLRRRYARCTAPGCRRLSVDPQTGKRMDLDHAIGWSRGGRTATGNAAPRCRRCHNLKTHHGWRVMIDPRTGVVTTTSPGGMSADTWPAVLGSLRDTPTCERPPPPVAGSGPPGELWPGSVRDFTGPPPF